MVAGIGVIRNSNNKEFVFKSYDLEKQWEIYQKQLNLKIHHNKKLQEDWNEFGSSNFEFIIIEKIDDEFILLEEFEDYLLNSDNYNSFDISDFYFEYASEDVITSLYQIIGRDVCSVDFKEVLEFNELPIDFYDEIKTEMISLINEGIVTSENLKYKLDDLILEKAKEHRILTLNLQEKLLDELHDVVGIGGLNKEFISILKENNLSEEIGYKIRENIEELIFLNNVIENNISRQIDVCISKYHNKISEENKRKLLFKVDNLENDEIFLNKVSNLNFTSENILNIIGQLKEFISSGTLFEDNFDEKLNQAIDGEVERIWLENKNKLVRYLNKILDENNVNPDLKVRLESNYLDLTLIPKFKELILTDINKKEISNINEIDLKLDQLIDEEISSMNQLKDDLLILLEEQYGVNELSESFKRKLDEVKLSQDDGKEFMGVISEEISSFKIKSDNAINIRVDELILERNKHILINQFDNLVGKDKNNDSFSAKLKSNYLTDDDGNEIRNELLNSIVNANEIQQCLDLRDNLELKLDELISKRKQDNYNKLMNLSNELIQSLETIIGFEEINESFKSKLYSNNLGEETGVLIKNELMDYIKKEDPNLDYESKMNQLKVLKTKTVKLAVDEIISRESVKRDARHKLLKKQLLSQLYELIGQNENTDYFNGLLLENNLDDNASLAIRKEFKEIIDSDDIYYRDKFNYKYEELSFVKSKTVKEILLDLVKNQKNIYEKKLTDMRNVLFGQLYEIIGKDDVTESFKKRLRANELSIDYAQSFKNEIKEFICSDEVGDNQFYSKLNELIDLKDKGIDIKIQELIDRESKIKLQQLSDIKGEFRISLDKLIGLKINTVYYDHLLSSNNLNSQTGELIRNELLKLITSDNPVNKSYEFKLDELLALKDTGLKNHLKKVIDRERDEYLKNLKFIREKLLNSLNLTLSRNMFKEDLYSKQIDDSFINVINDDLMDLINSDIPRNDNFELKLDELKNIDANGIDIYINQLIKPEAEIRQKELIELRQTLTDELYKIMGKDSDSFVFNYKLVNYNITGKAKSKIRNKLINLISSQYPIDNKFKYKLAELRYINDHGLEKKVDDVLKRENERYNIKLKEKRQSLIDSMNVIIGKNTINLAFKNKLQSFDLDEDFSKDIKNEIINFINSDDVTDDEFDVKLDELIDLENKGIETKIDEIIQIEFDRKNARLIENQLKELHDITGDTELSDSFIEKLNSGLLEKEFGYKIKYYYESEITSLKIKEGFDFKTAIDDMILDEIKSDLLNQTYEIIGRKSNSEYYNNKLKASMITSKRGEEIREELLSQIKDSDLDRVIELKNKGMPDEFNKIISKEATSRQNQQMELRLKLLNELNNIVNMDLFKQELISKGLDETYVDLIKSEIRDLIRLNDIVGDFEYKVDELEDINHRGINNEIIIVMDKYAIEVKEKSEKIKKELLDDLKVYSNQLSSKISFNSYGISSELKKRDLYGEYGQKAIDELENIINSNKIIDSKFSTKLNELEDIKEKTVKIKLNEILDEYAENQKYLINVLITTLNTTDFSQKLKNKNLYPETYDNVLSDVKEKIKKGKITASKEVEIAISDYINNEAVEIKKALDKLYEIVGSNGISFKFKARLRINGLSSNNGKLIVQIVEDKIKTEKLRENNVKNEIDKQIEIFIDKKKRKPLSVSSNAPKYVFCDQCGHRNNNGSNFCEQCGSRLTKLKGGK